MTYRFKNINMKSLFETFIVSCLPDRRIVSMEAIWLTNYVTIGTGENKYRLDAGMEIRVCGGEIVNCSKENPPTHRIAGCIGTMDSSHLEFILMDLYTGMPENLKVK